MTKVNLMEKNAEGKNVPNHATPDDHFNVKKTGTRRIFKKTIRITLIIIGGVLGVVGLLSYRILASAGTNIDTIIQKEEKTPLYKQVGYLLSGENKPLQGEDQDRVNVLLIGMGGKGHSSGIYLADTIMVASFKPSTGQVALLSIPRDMVVEMKLPNGQNLGYRKINNANAFGRQYKYPGGGEKFTADILEKVLNMPIHYFVRVDFEGFRKTIDTLGGVNVNAERSFVDYQYPDYSYGYQTVRFQKGWQTMNGEHALQFARSRKGITLPPSDGISEGSDFARSKRQQKIIFAAKEKFFSAETLLSPKKITGILENLGEHVATSMEIWEMMRFAEIAKNAGGDKVINKVLDNSPTGLLRSEISDEGAYVLIPTKGLGKYEEIQKLSAAIFSETSEKTEETTIDHEPAEVDIRNGTKENNLAKKIGDEMSGLNFTISNIGNALTQTGNEKTVIYDFTDGKKPKALQLLRTQLNANIATGIPAYLRQEKSGVAQKVDFIIIVGEDNTTWARNARNKELQTNPNQNTNGNTSSSKNTNSSGKNPTNSTSKPQ